MKQTLYLCLIVFLLTGNQGKTIAQEFTFMFYNVENLFDTTDDTLVADEEFTADGEKHWSQDRYHMKLDNIARVMKGIGRWDLPAIVGLCEVENRKVLMDLRSHRLLDRATYSIIHRDSPDGRGIDVALLYRDEVFDPIKSQWIPIIFESEAERTTRDILYVKGILNTLDTVHIFINHWPSRWGGVEASEPRRVEVARKLKMLTDSIFMDENDANILIAGDFNDNPIDSSMHKVLNAGRFRDQSNNMLVNLMFDLYHDGDGGTLKYRENWEMYDQIIISPAMRKLQYNKLLLDGPFIYAPEYLLEKDERYLGDKPFRTYAGPRYLGGFSDHLPVYIRYVLPGK
jgi:predicted extracellular nuclease